MAGRLLIVNADDFGQSPGVNRGIIDAHEHGIVTSASLMVRWPAALAAGAYARAHPALSVGLHVDLGEWACRDGEWNCFYEVVPLEDRDGVQAQVTRQLELFQQLTGRAPSHLDSHQHVHRDEPLRSILIEWARKLCVPLRHFTPRLRYCGSFYGQMDQGAPYPEGISLDGLLQTLSSLRPGMTELGCHPGLDGDIDSMYRWERAEEVKSLCDPRARETLAAGRIELRSFGDLAGTIIIGATL